MKKNQLMLIVGVSLFSICDQVAAKLIEENIPGVAVQFSEHFYTGKPYDADLGAYTFNYRSYDPNVARWTSADPSGFLDGANNHRYVPVPTTQLDPEGLLTVNGGTFDSGTLYSSNFPGYFNYAYYHGLAYASASADSGTVNMSSYIIGATLLLGGGQIERTPSINVMVNPDGTLNYSTSGSFGGADGVVGTGISFVVDGVGTSTLTVRVYASWALDATTVNGGGASTNGGSISFGTASRSDGPAALGTFVFTE